MAHQRRTSVPVLIVGAGPTGLVLALSLARRGVPFRIIDEHDAPGRESRAMGVHARTLECYRQFGFADDVIAQGVVADAVHLRTHGRDHVEREARVFSLKDMGSGLSPYPFLLAYPQDLHERFLVSRLAELGIDVERQTKLAGFVQNLSSVRATVETASGLQEFDASYVVGCDGARSKVRETLGLGFAGGTYEQLFYVADVRIERGFDADVHINLGAKSLVLMMPVRKTGMQRLIGLVPPGFERQKNLSFEDLRAEITPLLGVKVTELNWFSTYRVQHRVAERFHVGNAFIAGDAGHLHSPAGGQGMNTGIGDAANLGWKLADVLRRRAPTSLLDSYEPERMPFARRLVSTTDKAFETMIASGLKGDIVRNWVAPALVGLATGFEVTRQAAFRTLSQIDVRYPDSPLSEGKAGVRGGDRLPWVEDAGEDNFDPLRSLDWQAHVYGAAVPGLAEACKRRALPLHGFAWTPSTEAAGFERNATYLIRPDGYVALANGGASPAPLEQYLDRHGFQLDGDSRASGRHPQVA